MSAAALDPEERLDLLLRDLGTKRSGLVVLATFPFVVRGTDELRRWVVRRRG